MKIKNKLLKIVILLGLLLYVIFAPNKVSAEDNSYTITRSMIKSRMQYISMFKSIASTKIGGINAASRTYAKEDKPKTVSVYVSYNKTNGTMGYKYLAFTIPAKTKTSSKPTVSSSKSYSTGRSATPKITASLQSSSIEIGKSTKGTIGITNRGNKNVSITYSPTSVLYVTKSGSGSSYTVTVTGKGKGSGYVKITCGDVSKTLYISVKEAKRKVTSCSVASNVTIQEGRDANLAYSIENPVITEYLISNNNEYFKAEINTKTKRINVKGLKSTEGKTVYFYINYAAKMPIGVKVVSNSGSGSGTGSGSGSGSGSGNTKIKKDEPRTSANKKNSNNNNTKKSSKEPAKSSKKTSSSGKVSNTVIKKASADKIAPTIKSIEVSTDSKRKIHNNSSITYTVTFSEDVTGLTKNGIEVSGGTISSITGSGKTYKVNVNTTNKKTYQQGFKIKKKAVKDKAGNTNTNEKTNSLSIDREIPVITVKTINDKSLAENKNITVTSKDTLKVTFDAKDANLDTSKLDSICGKDTATIAKNISLTIDKKTDASAKLSLKKLSTNVAVSPAIVNYAASSTGTSVTTASGGTSIATNTYELTVSNLSKSGNIALQANSGLVTDLAENNSVTTNLLGATSAEADNTKPAISSITIKSSNTNSSYAKNGDTITLTMQADTDYSALTTKPTVTIGGKQATVSGSGKKWTATLKIEENENVLQEGILPFSISNYAKSNGLIGDTKTATTDNTKVTYDRTSPVLDGQIDYNTKNGKATNNVWQKQQNATLKAKDNLTEANKIKTKYVWIQNAETVTSLWNVGENGKTISKNDGTGKFRLQVMYEDLAGNIAVVTTDEFYLDNSVTTPGKIIATKNTKDGALYISKSFTSDNIYLSLEKGKDDESGHKLSVYQVTKETENGKFVIGNPTTEDTLIEDDGHYIVKVITKDNLDNTAESTLEIYKGVANVALTDKSKYTEGDKKYTGQATVNVKLTDTFNEYTNAAYAWVKEGEESNITYSNFSNINNLKQDAGVDLNKTGVNGKYYLYVKTTDKNGNENITKSNAINIQGTISEKNLPTVTMKKVNPSNLKELGDYTNDTWTKEAVYLKINSDGKDDLGNKLTDVSYRIVNGANVVVGSGTTESAILINEGVYTVTVTAQNKYGATGTRTYKVKIDKTAPNVGFTGTENYGVTQNIGVNISDAASGVKENISKYYWTRSTKTPAKEDFYGSEEGGFRGSITSNNSNISVPKNVSGIWYLWVYTEDNAGNETIKSSVKIEGDNTAYVDNEKPIAGEIKMKEKDKDGPDYTLDGNFTKSSIYMELINGYDADSGVKSNTYSIKKNGSNYKSNLTTPETITEDGEYVITVTTIDNQSNKTTREYTLKIDKTSPVISIRPDGNEIWAKAHKVTANITDAGSGVESSKTIARWIGYDENKYKNFNEISAEIERVIKNETIKEHIKDLKESGIFVEETTINDEVVKTPANATGKYYLNIYAVDKLGNSKNFVSSKPYFVNNTNPTKPDITSTENKKIGSKYSEVRYYGNATNNKVTVYASNSSSVSGITKYEVAYQKDNGTWSNWKNATATENNVVTGGKKEFTQEGRYVVKFRAVSDIYEELPTSTSKDAKLISEESEEVIVQIDLTGPEVSFVNYKGGTNGNTERSENAMVRATATDKCGVNTDTLRYAWVKFANVNEFENYKKASHSLEELVNKMGKGTSFANGEEISSIDKADGIYSLMVYSEDNLGNASVHLSNYYNLHYVEKWGEFTYKLNDDIIYRVKPETKVKDFVEIVDNKFKAENYVVYDKNGNEISNEDYEQKIITTNSKIKVNGKTYRISVIGDLNEDGYLNAVDLTRIRFTLIGKVTLTDLQRISADINDDNNVNGVDLTRIRFIIVGLINID